MWRVLLHNDDYTTQEFVVWVLESVFRKPRMEAVEVMMRVHLSGIGVAGIYTHDVAETKAQEDQADGRRAGIPAARDAWSPSRDQNMSKTPVPFAPETLRNDSASLSSRVRSSS